MDNSRVWTPFTQMATAPPSLEVVAASGAYLQLADGRRLLDAISSWWVTLHGHAQPEIAAAVAAQAARLEQVIAAGFTHPPAEELARRLATALPLDEGRVFFSDNGSTAVEVALKVAFQYWRNKGQQGRRRFLTFEGAYHGDTLGAMSVSGRSLFTAPFESLLFEVDTVPFPATWPGDEAVQDKEEAALAQLGKLLEAAPEGYAAMILEPLVQGAGGMRMCRPEFLPRLGQLLKDCGVLAIYDEVMTGFGRTGELFACTKAATEPDIVCLAKGLSGGFVPLAATVCNSEVFEAFWSEDFEKAFFHGHSFTANPIGCAAALASLELLGSERFRDVAAWQQEEMAALDGHPRLRRGRVCGTVAAVEVCGEEGYASAVGSILRQRFLERGILLRPLGNIVYILPPYCVTRGELAGVYRVLREEVEVIVGG